MANMTNNNDNLVLKPLAGMRGKKHDTLKGCTVEAVVDLFDGWARDGYHHPTLTLHKVGRYSDGHEFKRKMLEIRFQRNDITRKPEWRTEAEPAARGFLAGERGVWGRAYAGHIEGELGYVDYLTTGLTLLERAKEAVKKNDKLYRNLSKYDDALLSLIVGLRRIGVTVVVRGARRADRDSVLSLVA